MGQIQKIADEYYIEFYARGLLYQQKAGKDIQVAQKLLAEIEEKIAQGEFALKVRDVMIEIFFHDFLKNSRTQFHPKTIQRLESATAHFQNFLSRQYSKISTLSQITPRVCEDYRLYLIQNNLISQKLNPKKVNFTLLLMRDVFDYGIKMSWINDNPFLHSIFLPIPKSMEVPDDRILQQIIGKTVEQWRDMYQFIRQTGLRFHEIERLTWEHVQLEEGVIFVRYRKVPLNQLARAILQHRYQKIIDYKAYIFAQEGNTIPSYEEFKMHFESLSREINSNQLVNFIDLRQSFIFDLFLKKISLLQAGKILGVADIARMMRFASWLCVRRTDLV